MRAARAWESYTSASSVESGILDMMRFFGKSNNASQLTIEDVKVGGRARDSGSRVQAAGFRGGADRCQVSAVLLSGYVCLGTALSP